MYALMKENKKGLTKVIAKSESLEKIFNKIDDLKLERMESDYLYFYERDLKSIRRILNKRAFYFWGYSNFIYRVYFIKTIDN